MIELHLPLPPSVNATKRILNRGRVPYDSKPYKEWKQQAGLQCILQKAKGLNLHGKLAVDIQLNRPNGNADLDNRIKPTLDLLQQMQVITNDKHIHDLRARWADVEGAVVRIEELK